MSKPDTLIDRLENPLLTGQNGPLKREAAAVIRALQRERDEYRATNEAVAVCARHTAEVVGGSCLVCENEALREALRREIDALDDEASEQRENEAEQAYEEKTKHAYAADLLEEVATRLRALTTPDTE